MIDIIFSLIPIAAIILSLFLCRVKMNYGIVLHLFSLLVSFILVFTGFKYTSGNIKIDDLTYFVYVLISMNGSAILSILKRRSYEIKNIRIFQTVFHVIELMLAIFFITDNLIIILSAYIAQLCLFFVISTQGHYPKDIQNFKREQILVILASFLTIIFAFIMATISETVSIAEITILSQSWSNGLKTTFFALAIAVLLLPCILFPIIKIKSMTWTESNHYIVQSKQMMQIPIVLLIFFRFCNQFNLIVYNDVSSVNINFSIILMIIGLIGVIVGVMTSIYEITGRLVNRSKNFKKINGSLSFAFFNALIIIFALIPFFNSESTIISWGIGLIFVMVLWIVINQLMYISTILNLDDQSIHNITLAKNVEVNVNTSLFYVIIITLILTPGFIGYIGFINLSKTLLSPNITDTIPILIVNIGFFSLLATLFAFLFVIATYEGHIFYTKKNKIAKFNDISENYSNYLPIIITVCIFIFASVIYYVWNSAINQYLSNLINIIFM